LADRDWLWLLVPLLALWAATRWLLLPWWRRQLRQRRHRRHGDEARPRGGSVGGGEDGTAAAVRFSTFRQLGRVRSPWTLRARRWVPLLRLLTLALLVLALARPQTGSKLTETSTEGVDIMLVIDTSGSMQALDLDPDPPLAKRRNRLQVVRQVVEDFIDQRDNDQIGLVVFGAEAFTQCPLTLDHSVVASFLDRLEIGMAGDATAIGSALGTAVKRLRDSPAKSKVVVLLTDGRSNAGSLPPLKAAEVAATFGVKVYTVGAGTRGQAPFLVDTLLGKQVVYENVEIDEETLQQIAATTGGSYFRAEDREALRKVYERIDRLERTEITQQSYMEYEERFGMLVLPAVALLLLEVLLLGTRFRKVP
jgi:Ca-activated chloride channel family protein